jgi:hypothetical protein
VSRAVGLALVALLIILTGCAAPLGGAPTVSETDAKERALQAEESYLRAHLSNASCLENWGTSPTVTNEEATVVNRTQDGVLVAVKHPFSYTTMSTSVDDSDSTLTARSYADGASRARYLVTEEVVRRISGDEIQPC